MPTARRNWTVWGLARALGAEGLVTTGKDWARLGERWDRDLPRGFWKWRPGWGMPRQSWSFWTGVVCPLREEVMVRGAAPYVT